MTELDDAMKEHMAYLVFGEHKSFCYKDFMYFVVNGKSYTMTHGTFRNKLLKMMQNNEVELYTKSNPNFYTLKGHTFDNGKLMTSNHTEANNISTQKIIRHPIYQILEGTPLGERAIHNLHLKFNIQGIYDILSNNPDLKKEINPYNKGIKFCYHDINEFSSIVISVYPTDTCKVVIGCSENPAVLDFLGIKRLTTALCRIEGRLSNLCTSISESSIKVHDFNNWIITLWHIGKDSISEYSGPMFHCEWNLAENIILRIYSKRLENKKNKIRSEIQQNPNITVEELKKVILEKI
ncbi:MAG: hypothetical protein ACRD6U_05930 [Nitrososphaeraceae archaeon]